MPRPIKSGRRTERHPLSCPIQISWQTDSGESRAVWATCLDVSAEGAGVECRVPLPFRAVVYMKAPSYGLMGNATVRYCRSQGFKYHVGLEFSWAAALAEAGRKQALNSSAE